tara:strand:+ start:1342 stop:1593 length:252 start_codon:yes stop_codon:yes gene_type:complete
MLLSKSCDIKAEVKGTTGVRTIEDLNSFVRCCIASRFTALISNLITSYAVEIAHLPFLHSPYINNKKIDLAKQASKSLSNYTL